MKKTDIYDIIRLQETDSTNEYAKKLAKAGVAHGTVVIAEKQIAGKGRLGRSFFSDEGKGVFMSLVLRPDVEPEKASRLTLVAAVAVRRAIKSICGLATGIKWPNDLIISGKKICGILTEMATDGGKVKYVILGIGVNVSNDCFEAELSQTATSIYMATGNLYNKQLIADEILKEFAICYDGFLISGDLSSMKQEYDESLVNMEKQVKIINGNTTLEGICKGIGDEGELIVETDNGTERIISGEVSVRGVYGYV